MNQNGRMGTHLKGIEPPHVDPDSTALSTELQVYNKYGKPEGNAAEAASRRNYHFSKHGIKLWKDTRLFWYQS